MDLIWRNSYTAVSVDDICRQAEVKKGSFYYFFPSKSDLALAAYDAHWHELRPLLDDIVKLHVSAGERIGRVCDLVVQGQLERYLACGRVCGCPYSSLGSELSSLDEQLRQKSEELLSGFTKYLENLIREAVATGEIPRCNHVAKGRAASACILGLLLQAKVENNLAVLEGMKPAILELAGYHAVSAA